MYTKQEIILRCYRDGESSRSISRRLQINRKTVKKYIDSYEELLQSGKTPEEAQRLYLTTAPTYKASVRPKVKLTAEIKSAIDSLLELNRKKQELGLRKQQLKIKDVLEELHRQQFDIGYTTVCNYVREKKDAPSSSEAFIRQQYVAGEICEFDWGEIKLNLSDRRVRIQMAVFTSAYSNYRYGFLFHRQDTQSFMESHVRFFDVTGGVFRQMVYDNMRVAVSKFVGPHEKEPTAALLQLRGHYGFSHRFCNAYRGNEKGHVERSVEYVRRKAFGLTDHFVDIQEAEAWLFEVLDKLNNQKQSGTGKTAMELFSVEKEKLGMLPLSRVICAEQVQLRVDKYATICYRTNRYSVPDYLVGKFVDASIRSEQLDIYHESKKIAIHERSYEKHQWVVDIEHYLSTFKRKPGALAGSVALTGSAYLKTLYQTHFTGEPRNFIDLLCFCRTNKVEEEKLEETVKRILTTGNGLLTVEKLQALLGNKERADMDDNQNGSSIKEDQIRLMSQKQLSTITRLLTCQNN